MPFTYALKSAHFSEQRPSRTQFSHCDLTALHQQAVIASVAGTAWEKYFATLPHATGLPRTPSTP